MLYNYNYGYNIFNNFINFSLFNGLNLKIFNVYKLILKGIFIF